MKWYDMIWYDVMLDDMIWYNMIWWYDMIWYDIIWYHMTWYDMISHDTSLLYDVMRRFDLCHYGNLDCTHLALIKYLAAWYSTATIEKSYLFITFEKRSLI